MSAPRPCRSPSDQVKQATLARWFAPFALRAALALAWLPASWLAPGPAATAGEADGNATDAVVSRIFFGSCIKQDQPVPILETILQQRPDVFIFLGDNIYADTTDMQLMRAKYQRLGDMPAFRQLRRSCRILATWDDHDYGANDGGATYPRRQESERLFLDFWQVPRDSPRRQRPGVYGSSIFGPPGRRVQVLLLDTRYFRSPLATGPQRLGGPYYPSEAPDLTLLGEPQWKWLEAELQQPADVRIIASSIQCLAEAAGQETWANLPRERSRLFQLLRRHRTEGVLLISGDRHWAELSRVDDALAYPLYELTSSSLNQPHPRGTPTPNAHRVPASNAGDLSTYHAQNYGVLLIDWELPDPSLQFEVRDLEGRPRISQSLRLGQLRHPRPQ